ncbi:MAG: hypothetical protein LBU35_03350 [Holosporales bacterium]|jgi:hypothetical protein|nr:hypothetical protein [Holosporales bacterium]
MTKKGIITPILVLGLIGIGIITTKHMRENSNIEHKKIYNANNLHSEILRLIASSKDKASNISPKDAQIILDFRVGKEVEVDKQVPNIKELPFDIIKLIAKSPTSIANISPRKALNEITRRYLVLETAGEDNIDPTILLDKLRQKQTEQTKDALEKWAENEDAEAVEAFMKEEADREPSDFANFAYGLKHINDKHSEALTYMERFANHAHSDSFDVKNEKESYDALIAAIRNLK